MNFYYFNYYLKIYKNDLKDLPTFEEQANYWKQNSSLPSLSNPTGNVNRRLENTVEELEKAYLYIEQQQNKINDLEKRLGALEQLLIR